MIIRPTQDLTEILSILDHPDIKPHISDEDTDKASIPINSEYLYLLCVVNDLPIGLAIFHTFRDGLEAHYQVLKEYRKDYGIKFAKEALKLDVLQGRTLYGIVPSYYQNVIAFDKSIGFEHVDTIKNSFTKDSKTYDEYIMRLKNGLS